MLDKADQLLDMGLGDQIKQIVGLLPTKTWEKSILVSATMNESIRQLAEMILDKSDWVTVQHEQQQQDSSSTSNNNMQRQLLQYHIVVSAKWRFPTLVAFLLQHRHEKSTVFLLVETMLGPQVKTILLTRWPWAQIDRFEPEDPPPIV